MFSGLILTTLGFVTIRKKRNPINSIILGCIIYIKLFYFIVLGIIQRDVFQYDNL